MKYYLLVVLIFSIAISYLMPKSFAQGQDVDIKGHITISGAWALYPMVVKWSDEFQKTYPDIKIDISAGGAGKGITDVLSGAVDLGMVSRDINTQELQKGIWVVSVAKNTVVATVNAQNPVIKDILAKGITKEILQKVFISGDIKTWGQIVKNNNSDVINVYTRSDACGAAETWAKYLGKSQEDLVGIGVYGDPGIVEAVKKDKFGIGFNNINFAYDVKTNASVAGIMVASVYPPLPARDLYLVSNGAPQSKEVRAFLRWVLTDGQKFVSETGFINVSQERIKEDLGKL